MFLGLAWLGIDNQIAQNLLHALLVCPHEKLLFRQFILQFKICIGSVHQAQSRFQN